MKKKYKKKQEPKDWYDELPRKVQINLDLSIAESKEEENLISHEEAKIFIEQMREK